MNLAHKLTVWALVLNLSGGPAALLAQPVIIQPGNPFGNRQAVGNGVENLRVSQMSPDGTEAQLTMDYSYDGIGGPVAQLLPVIGKKGQSGVSGWFGSDPITVGRGRGTVTLKVRYFNDEPGVPATFTSDQVRILILNRTGSAILAAVPFLKNIKWGSPNAAPAAQEPQLAQINKAAAEKLAAEKRLAEAKATAEAEAREKARLQAEAEVTARREAEEKARAEVAAREEARKKALAEAQRIEKEKQRAEEIRLAQERARAEEQKRAEERARQEAQALADANARAEAQRKAEAEAKRLQEERRLAEAKQIAEEKARQEARLKAEAEAKQLAEEKRRAEEKVLAEAKARKEAEQRAWQEAVAQAKAELEAKKLAAEKKQAEALASTPAPAEAPRAAFSTEIDRDKRTRITNVDVVNRSLDRTQMTFGVEFEYKDQIKEPQLGLDVLRQSQPDASRHFVSQPAEIGKSRRNFVLLPVKFQPAAALPDQSDYSTDQVLVYLTGKSGAQRYNIYPATMLLRWRAPGSHSAAVPRQGNAVEIEDFKQNDPSNGYITIRYNLLERGGKLRAKVYESGQPASAAYFHSNMPEVKAGSGIQLIDVAFDPEARLASNLFRADTIDIELVDAQGQVLARTSKQAAMVWARPQ